MIEVRIPAVFHERNSLTFSLKIRFYFHLDIEF